jgi:hypothetical protein
MGKHVHGTDLAVFGESRAIPIFLLTTLLISSVFYWRVTSSLVRSVSILLDLEV